MADDVAITAGTGTTIGADERTISAVLVKVQRVVVEGGTAFATAQYTPTAAAATLIAARETRKSVVIVNGSNVDIFVGPATVTTANGIRVSAGASLTINTTALIQSISSSITGLVGVVYTLETYDA